MGDAQFNPPPAAGPVKSPDSPPPLPASRGGADVPPPLPPQVLVYSAAHQEAGRPGLLVAIGSVSLMVGLLSLVASVAGTWFFWSAAAMSKPPAPPPAPPPLPPIAVAPFSVHPPRAGGLSATAAQDRLRPMKIAGPFADDRRAMLLRLFLEAGETTGGYYEPVIADAPSTQPADVWAPAEYRGPRGTITVNNTTAQFEPRDDGPKIVVTDVGVIRNNSLRWSMGAIDERVAELRKQLPAVTDLQAGRLAQLLEMAPATPPPAAGPRPDSRFFDGVPLGNCFMLDSTVLNADVNHIPTLILPDGRSIASINARFGLDPVTGSIRPAPRPPFVTYFPGPITAMKALSIVCGMNGMAALLILGAGLSVLARRRYAGAWHLHWTGLKLILIVVEVGLLVWLITKAKQPFRVMRLSPKIGTFSLNPAWTEISLLGIGAIYPVVLLLVILNSERIRRYYSAFNIHLPVLAETERRALARPGPTVAVFAAIALALTLALANVVISVWVAFEKSATSAAIVHAVIGGLMLLASFIFVRRAIVARREGAMA